MYKIMVVEDDMQIGRIICESLRKQGFECLKIEQFDNVVEQFKSFEAQLVLMDINLPGSNGFLWCEKIRAISKTPIIFISARNSDMDIITAMSRGGDDYLIKPFSAMVLVAKVKGMLRRTYDYKEDEIQIISYKDLMLNVDSGILLYKQKQQELTHNEKRILQILIKNQGKVVSREKIMRDLWSDERFIDDNTLTVNMTRIRKKLTLLGCTDSIRTVRNEGYVL